MGPVGLNPKAQTEGATSGACLNPKPETEGAMGPLCSCPGTSHMSRSWIKPNITTCRHAHPAPRLAHVSPLRVRPRTRTPRFAPLP